MGIMFQTFTPDLEMEEKGLYLLEKWNQLSDKAKEKIIKEVIGDGLQSDLNEKLANAINNASSDQS